jgi:hypothetical protein
MFEATALAKVRINPVDVGGLTGKVVKAVDEFIGSSRSDEVVKIVVNKSVHTALTRQYAHYDYDPSLSRVHTHQPSNDDNFSVFFTPNPKGCHLMVIYMSYSFLFLSFLLSYSYRYHRAGSSVSFRWYWNQLCK